MPFGLKTDQYEAREDRLSMISNIIDLAIYAMSHIITKYRHKIVLSS